MRKWTRVAAYGLIVRTNRILLCRLAAIEQNVGKWTLPGGGLEFGESPEDAALREIQEETGLKASLKGLADVDSVLYEYQDRKAHSIRILYWAEVESDALCVEVGGSTDGCDWFTEEEALSLPLVDLAKLGISLAFDQAARLRSTSL